MVGILLSVYEDIMKEVYYRDSSDTEKCQYFIYSMCYHIFNHINYSRAVGDKLMSSDTGAHNYRLSVASIGPSGSGKSHWMRLFCDDPNGILFKDTTFKASFCGETTAAGAVGTQSDEKGAHGKESPGLFKTEKRNIIAYEEFGDLQKAFEAKSHNIGFLDAFLQALETGQVKKRLGNINIDYMTHATVWLATQPTRIDLSSGFFRRILFINYLPAPGEGKKIKERNLKRRKDKASFDKRNIDFLRKSVNEMQRRLYTELKNVDFSDEYIDFINSRDITNKDMDLYEMLAIGYHIAHDLFDSELIIGVPDGLKKCIDQEIEWRAQIAMNPVKYILYKIVEDHGKPISDRKLYQIAKGEYELTHSNVTDILNEMNNHELTRTGFSSSKKKFWSINQEDEEDAD